MKSGEVVKKETDVFESASDSSLADENVKKSVEASIPQVVDNITDEPRKQVKPRQPVKYAEMYRKKSTAPRGNQRSWNHMISQRLGSDFVMNNKACYICGSFEHLHAKCNYHVGRREVFGKTGVKNNKVQHYSHPNSNSKMIPRAVQLRSGLKTFTTAKSVNTAYVKKPVSSAPNFAKSAQTRNKIFKNKRDHCNFQWVPKTKSVVATAKPAVSTAKPKVPTAKAVNTKKGNLGSAVKASARWEWKPKGNNTQSNPNGVSMTFDRFNYIDTLGRSKSIVAWIPKSN